MDEEGGATRGLDAGAACGLPVAACLPTVACFLPPFHPPSTQNNVLGAYPFHFHFVGDASGQMATDNSVYR